MGSATEITGGSEETRRAEEAVAALAGTRAQAMAQAIPVNATGTRPGSGPDKRELFSEDTETVLVFPDGAMIRLSAAVATGQLIFLTNIRTNVEMVCQVVGKRVYRPTNCYVELQFTEPLENFWGVTFPPAETAVQAAEPQVESVVTAEVTEDSVDVHAPLPSNEEVKSLRGDVAALKEQLKSTAKMAEVAPALEPIEAVAPVAPVGPPQVAVGVQEELMAANEPAPTLPAVNVPSFEPAVVVAPAVPHPPPLAVPEAKGPVSGKTFALAEDVAAAKKREVKPAVTSGRPGQVAMSLPKLEPPKIDPEQEVIDQLLPQPELDFSKIPPPRSSSADPDDPYSIYKPAKVKREKWVLLLLTVGLLGAVGFGVWKLGLVQGRMTRWADKKSAQVAAKGKTNAAAPTAPATGALVTAAGKETATTENGEGAAAQAATEPATAGSDAPPGSATAENAVPVAVAGNVPAKASDFHAAGPAPDAAAKKSSRSAEVTKRGGGVAKSSGKKAPVAEEPKASVEEPVAEDAPFVPAKLLRSANPVYPPDAMRNFITGDVRLKAEVNENGHVRNMTVVSGPVALRPAAIEAMKQYEYVPATKGGKGVASEVAVTIKFWFDP